MKRYVIALDQGTTSSRAILFDNEQNIVGLAQKEFTQLYPRAGYVEHDPLEIYSSQYAVLMEVLLQSAVDPNEVAAIGITNQRETTIVWDRHTGRPVYNAIVWQCRRTADICEQLKADGFEPDCWQTLIFPVQKSNGSSTMFPERGKKLKTATCSSAQLTAG